MSCSQIEALDIFRVAAEPDNEGRPVLIFLPANLPEGDEALLERATLFVFARMHQLVVVESRDYTVLWLCHNRDTPGSLSLRWWRRTYWTLPYCYHTRLHSLCVVHPSLSVRAYLLVLSYLPRHSFWEKLDYADRLEFLDAHVPIALIKSLPQEVKEYDKELDREMYSSNPADQLGALGGGAQAWTGAGGLGPGMASTAPGGSGDGGPNPPMELPKRNWE